MASEDPWNNKAVSREDVPLVAGQDNRAMPEEFNLKHAEVSIIPQRTTFGAFPDPVAELGTCLRSVGGWVSQMK